MAGFNEQQQKAIDSNAPRILCLAAAGCGKTKTLLGRIERLIHEGVDPSRILALTFTNAAAFEMKERYKQIPNIDLNHGVPEFRTFHSFCYSLIVKNTEVRSRLGYAKVPEVCDDNHMKEIRKRVKLQLGITLSDEVLDKGTSASRKEQDQIDLFRKALIKEIKKENVITFDIMCYNVCELFEKDEPCIRQYKQKYTYLFCDEMQDSDKRQVRFIASFPSTTHFFLVGDVLQNIYGFRGCTNELVKQLAVDPNWQVIKMNKNYRSTTSICEFANKFSTYAKDEFRIEMEGQNGQGDPVEVIRGSFSSFDSPVDEYHLKLLIDKLKAHPDRETAILCRSNRECSAVKEALNGAGIQFSARTKTTDSVDLLNSALSDTYMLEWLSTKLEPKDYGDYIRLSSIEPNPDIRWFLSLYGGRDTIKKLTDKIVAIRNTTLDTSLSQAEKFTAIAKLLRAKSKCKFSGDGFTTNKELIEMIRDQIQEVEECLCYCGTIHSSKGLEYDTVYIMGVDDKLFPLGTEEMNNLYYVGVTRARNHLTVFRR